MKCDCIVCQVRDNGELLRDSNIVEVLTYISNSSYAMELYNIGTGIEPRDYLDRRRGYCFMFTYCPVCGIKINWKMIKNKFVINN